MGATAAVTLFVDAKPWVVYGVATISLDRHHLHSTGSELAVLPSPETPDDLGDERRAGVVEGTGRRCSGRWPCGVLLGDVGT